MSEIDHSLAVPLPVHKLPSTLDQLPLDALIKAGIVERHSFSAPDTVYFKNKSQNDIHLLKLKLRLESLKSSLDEMKEKCNGVDVETCNKAHIQVFLFSIIFLLPLF